jgi:hypothetical protein
MRCKSNRGAPADERSAAVPRAWKYWLPWAVLPLALAIITAVDWLKHGRGQTRRKEAG